MPAPLAWALRERVTQRDGVSTISSVASGWDICLLLPGALLAAPMTMLNQTLFLFIQETS